MLITIDQSTPTSDLLAIKAGSYLSNGYLIKGYLSEVTISDTDEFCLFIFTLSNGLYIEIKKIRNIC